MKNISYLFTMILLLSSASIVYGEERCPDFPSKLANCSPYKCEFTHPMFGTKMKREIVGDVGGKCRTTEDMPNNGKLECNFPKESLKEMSDHYAKLMNAKTIESNTKIGGGDIKTQSATKVDGTVLKKDPLNEAMRNGTCKITLITIPS